MTTPSKDLPEEVEKAIAAIAENLRALACAIISASAETTETISLDAYLRKNRITQRDFAAAINTSPVVINRLIKGTRPPGFGMMSRIERATNGRVGLNSWGVALAAKAGEDA